MRCKYNKINLKRINNGITDNKKTSSLGTLIIKEVSKIEAKEMIINNHYSHKWNDGGFGKFNFGIFKEENPEECLGVAVYGFMKNPKAKLYKHPNDMAWMCELNRMWIDDCLGKNAETVLIGASLKLLKKKDSNLVAVQSFADGRLGCGTIYKASNFKYFGFHYTRFLKNLRTGEITHEQIATNTKSPSGYMRCNMAYLLGDYEIMQVKTYRYIYPLCRKVEFKKPQEPYPPYNKGYELVEWKRDRNKIKNNIISLLDKIAV